MKNQIAMVPIKINKSTVCWSQCIFKLNTSITTFIWAKKTLEKHFHKSKKNSTKIQLVETGALKSFAVYGALVAQHAMNF